MRVSSLQLLSALISSPPVSPTIWNSLTSSPEIGGFDTAFETGPGPPI